MIVMTTAVMTAMVLHAVLQEELPLPVDVPFQPATTVQDVQVQDQHQARAVPEQLLKRSAALNHVAADKIKRK
jgi:hypothetical protein